MVVVDLALVARDRLCSTQAPPLPSRPVSGHRLDDLDQLVDAVALAAGEFGERTGLRDHSAPLGRAGDRDSATAAKLEQPSSRSSRRARRTVFVLTSNSAAGADGGESASLT